jgi:hypothetical protein
LLSEANLEAAYLASAFVQGADMQWANLNKAVLRYSVDLTPSQVQSARIDRETKVPQYLEILWTSKKDFRCEKK